MVNIVKDLLHIFRTIKNLKLGLATAAISEVYNWTKSPVFLFSFLQSSIPNKFIRGSI